MKFRNKTNPEVSINLTPLIDVVFLLLLFFMVSTTFKNNTQLNINLPVSSQQSANDNDQSLQIAIRATGEYEWEGQQYLPDEITVLRVKLENMENLKETKLYILGDEQSPHQSLVTLLEMAADLGISKVRILAKHKKAKPFQTAMN